MMRRLGEIMAISLAVSGAALWLRGRLEASLACGGVLMALVAIDQLAKIRADGGADQVRTVKRAAPTTWFIFAAVIFAGATAIVWMDERFSPFRLYLTVYFIALLAATAVAVVVRWRMK